MYLSGTEFSGETGEGVSSYYPDIIVPCTYSVGTSYSKPVPGDAADTRVISVLGCP